MSNEGPLERSYQYLSNCIKLEEIYSRLVADIARKIAKKWHFHVFYRFLYTFLKISSKRLQNASNKGSLEKPYQYLSKRYEIWGIVKPPGRKYWYKNAKKWHFQSFFFKALSKSWQKWTNWGFLEKSHQDLSNPTKCEEIYR